MLKYSSPDALMMLDVPVKCIGSISMHLYTDLEDNGGLLPVEVVVVGKDSRYPLKL